MRDRRSFSAARKQDEGDAVVAELGSKGDAFFVRCDVSSPEEIHYLIATTIEKHGRIDCLVNNAGSHPPHMPIDDFSVQDFRDLLDLNLISMFAACKYALPHIRKTKGNIINMSSLVGAMGQLHAVTYVASKGAIHGFYEGVGDRRS